MAVRSLNVELNLDDGNFTVKVNGAAGALNSFQRSVDLTDRSLQHATTTHRTFLETATDGVILFGQLRNAFQNIEAFTTGWAKSLIDANSAMEKTKLLMQALSGEGSIAGQKSAGQKNVQYILDLAEKAPFAVDELSQAFKRLKAGGIDPTLGSMQALVDGIAHSGGGVEQLNRASLALQEILGRGVLSMDHIRRQLSEAIPGSIQLLAEGLNVTVAQLYEMVKKGTLESKSTLEKMFVEIELQWGGSAERMMNSWQGLTAKLSTEWFKLITNNGAGTAFFAAMKEQLASLTDLISGPAFKDAFGTFDQGAAAAVRDLRSIIDAAVEYRDKIADVAEVLAAAFGGKLIISGGASIVQMLGTLKQSFVDLEAGATMVVAGFEHFTVQAAAAKDATIAKAAADREAAAAAQELIAVEHERVLAMNSAIMAEIELEKAVLKEIGTGYYASVTEAGRAASINRLAALSKDLSAANALLEASNERLAASEATVMAATAGLTEAELASSGAMGGLVTMLQGGIGMLGELAGPVGIAGMIIYSLADAFGLLEDHIKKATEAEEQFKNTGVASDRDVKEQELAIEKMQSRLEGLRRSYSRTDANGAVEWSNPDRANEAADLQKQIADHQQIIKQMQDAIANQGGEGRISQMRQQIDDQFAGITKAYMDNTDRLKSQLEDAQKKYGDKIPGTITDEVKAQHIAAIKADYDGQIAVLKSASDNLNAQIAQADSKNQKGLSARLTAYQNELRSKIDETQKQMASALATATGDNQTIGGDKGNKGASALDQLKQRLAAVQAEAAGAGKELARVKQAFDDALKADPKMSDTEKANWQARLDTAKQIDDVTAAYERSKKAKTADASAMDAINNEMEKTKNSSAELRDVIVNGSTEVQKANIAFASRMQALLSKISDPALLAQAKREVAELTAGYNNNSLEEAVVKMRTQTEQIKASLADQNTAAEMNYQAEVKRVQDLLAQDTTTGEERKAIEQDVQDYIAALREKANREEEGAVAKMMRQWNDTAQNMNAASAHWLSEFTDDLASGQLKFRNFTNEIVLDIEKIAEQKMISSTIGSSLDGLASAFGNLIGASMHHSGGIAGVGGGVNRPLPMSAFIGAPKFHGGGLVGSDEVPAILKRGELVLTEDQQKGMSGRSAPTIQFNVINQSSQPVDVSSSNTRFDGEKMIVDVVVANLNKPGPMRDAVRGVS